MRLSTFFASLLFAGFTYAQCDTTTINGSLIINSPTYLGGTIYMSGDFVVNAGQTVYVIPYNLDNCGRLEIHAQKIIINGTINGDYAGFPGGTGGAGGNTINSLTGDQNALSGCSNKDNSGQITVGGGQAGTAGLGNGAGAAGIAGGNGSGPKQQCQNNGDEAGLIPGAGGAGGGAGGTYGGAGSAGGFGGDGSDYYLADNLAVSPAFTIVRGNGGAGGASASTYGTQLGPDIAVGSGGGGGGGGGRSFTTGQSGGDGGAGGAMIYLVAADSLITGPSAIITANGEAGAAGGIGGDGGVSSKCCTDGCDDCGEVTLSCGAGGGAGGGGGSGGGILLVAQTHSIIAGTFSATGGNGGSGGIKGFGSSCTYSNLVCSDNGINSGNGLDGSAGGAGGGGRIKVFVNLDCGSVTAVMNVAGGISTVGNGAQGTQDVMCTLGDVDHQETEFKFFPNPVNDQLTITTSNYTTPLVIMVIDISGRVVFSDNLTSSVTVISAVDWPSGMYIIQITGTQNSYTHKIIKY